MLPEVEYVTANTLTDRRNKKVVFTTAIVCMLEQSKYLAEECFKYD